MQKQLQFKKHTMLFKKLKWYFKGEINLLSSWLQPAQTRLRVSKQKLAILIQFCWQVLLMQMDIAHCPGIYQKNQFLEKNKKQKKEL